MRCNDSESVRVYEIFNHLERRSKKRLKEEALEKRGKKKRRQKE